MSRSGPGRHDLRRVREPTSGHAALPRSEHFSAREVAVVAIADPYEPEKRVRALARIDLLDREWKAGKLDQASYLVGREVERIFESMSRISGAGQWFGGDRIDASTAAEIKAVLGLERAYAVNAFLGWLVRHVGRQDARLLWAVLGDRLTFAAAAAAFQRPGVRGLRYTIDRFHDALAALAEVKSARGRELR